MQKNIKIRHSKKNKVLYKVLATCLRDNVFMKFRAVKLNINFTDRLFSCILKCSFRGIPLLDVQITTRLPVHVIPPFCLGSVWRLLPSMCVSTCPSLSCGSGNQIVFGSVVLVSGCLVVVVVGILGFLESVF